MSFFSFETDKISFELLKKYKQLIWKDIFLFLIVCHSCDIVSLRQAMEKLLYNNYIYRWHVCAPVVAELWLCFIKDDVMKCHVCV